MEDNPKHTRVSNMLLEVPEQAALKWLAPRMPRWITPDVLTGIGLFAAILSAVSYWLTLYSPWFLWLASFGWVLNWFGDSLDGTLARHRHQERPKYGFFIDHSLDVLGGFLIGVGIGFSPYVRFDFAMIALSGYLLMSVSVYVRIHVTGIFQMTYSRIGTTEIRIFVILVNTLIFFIGNPHVSTFIGDTTVYDVIALFFGITLIGTFIVVTLVVGTRLRKSESR